MKKQLLLLVLLLSMVGAKASAYDIKVKNSEGVTIYYRWINNDTELEVTYSGPSFTATENILYSGNVVIPENVTYAGNTYSVTSIGRGAFHKGSITSVTIPNTVTKIGDNAFSNCNALTTIIIPNNVNYIGQYAFYDCRNLTSITIPDATTIIRYGTFSYCSKLNSVNFCTGLERIEGLAFCDCESLTNLVIPNNVSYIGSSFMNCSSLLSLTIGSGVTTICATSFWGNEIISDVYCLSVQVPEVEENDYYHSFRLFENTVHNNAILHVPAEAVNAYKSAEGWKYFKNIIAIEKPKYSLIYYVDGKEYKCYFLEEGETITPEPAPTKEGYSFIGWNGLPEIMPAHDVTTTGTFTINKYKLIYKVDGEVYNSYEIDYGTIITPEAEPTKEGYSFSGWSWIPPKMPAEDVTITGSFTINQYTITYMIDDEVYQTVKVDYNSKITPPTPPKKEGYGFAWGEYPETMPAHDITITGTYTTGIMSIEMGSGTAKIFTLEGKQLDQLQKGMNIVRMNDGRVQKVVVK